ncbi:MAG: HAD hydrolase-like protein, partial [Pseudomonadota bacterium]
MTRQAIIFGSIGTIADTSEMQLAAFNAAFDEAGLGWFWAASDYKPMLAKSGGKQRIQDFADRRGETVDASAIHQRKTAIFNDMMAHKGLAPRPGVLPLMKYAMDAGVKLGFATTTSQSNICAMFNALDGAL